MYFEKTNLENSLCINALVSVHYFEYSKGFRFTGESHDFWEFIYSDRRQLLITAGDEDLILNIGEMYLHKPNEFHNIRCKEESVANSVVVSFDCDCKELYNIAGKVIKCDSTAKKLLGQIVSEARGAFSNYLGDPHDNRLIKRKDRPFGSEQLLKMIIEGLLIHLIREDEKSNKEKKREDQLRANENRFNEICKYLQEHCEERLSFNDICRHFEISPSNMKRLFAAFAGYGTMEYFNRCKIIAAKELIREKNLKFSDIAKKLNYSSVQYFSRHFLTVTGMTPSQYAASVKTFMEDKEI